MAEDTTPCTDCGVVIQAATAERTKGKCMPCSRRRITRLKPDVQRVYEEFLAKLATTGWEASLPHRRQWLDLLERLKGAIRRNPEMAYLALAEKELSTGECANSDECLLTFVNLRILAWGKFAAEVVKDADVELAFELGGTTYRLDFDCPARQRREYLLTAVNEALSAEGVSQRFQLLPSQKSVGKLVFVDPACVEKAVGLGLIPGENA